MLFVTDGWTDKAIIPKTIYLVPFFRATVNRLGEIRHIVKYEHRCNTVKKKLRIAHTRHERSRCAERFDVP